METIWKTSAKKILKNNWDSENNVTKKSESSWREMVGHKKNIKEH